MRWWTWPLWNTTGACDSEVQKSVEIPQVQYIDRTPRGVDVMTETARRTVKDAVLWRGDQNLPVGQQGIGQEEYVKNHLDKKSDEHQVPLVQDLQAAWLLLFYCAGSGATFWLRSVRPQFTADFADREMWECFNQLVEIASLSAKASTNAR